jgi:D-tyrosyl-tRNA(Tyr) deacylase
MIGLLQRVRDASVTVEDQTIASIDQGLMVLVGIEKGDTERQADRLVQRLLNYRVFGDAEGRMNLNVQQISGGVLLVPQFTLAADTDHGNRPGFSHAAEPEAGRYLFEYVVKTMRLAWPRVETGRFGADMQVRLCNDGPVTISLTVRADD